MNKTNEITKLDQQWQATRYAIDMIDEAWSFKFDEAGDDDLAYERGEMNRHRKVLCDLQNDLLNRKYELEGK